MSNANGAPPGTTPATEESELYAPDGALALFSEQLTTDVSVPRPQTPAYPTITTAFATAVQEISEGKDVQESLDEAVAVIDEDIEENQGYPPPE